MDEFKKYINQRIEELDIDMPSEKVWQSIKQDLARVKHNATFIYMKWAVAACVITLAGFGLYKLQITSITTTPANNQQIAINNQLPTITNQQPAINNQQLATELPQKAAKVDMPDMKIQGQKLKAKDAINPSNYNPQTLNAETAIALLAQVENSFTQI
ncbi:MAG: hypothetical protein H7101_00550, partial [Deinococcales bacterium]|nr:hypothetical protein [Chitinophagaceae bacterium]